MIKDGICHIQAGAGIVIDSEPEREYYESLNKAKALMESHGICRYKLKHRGREERRI